VTWEEASALVSVSIASRLAFDGRRGDYPTLPESEIYPDQAFAWDPIGRYPRGRAEPLVGDTEPGRDGLEAIEASRTSTPLGRQGVLPSIPVSQALRRFESFPGKDLRHEGW
jgi:hypothetical protein